MSEPIFPPHYASILEARRAELREQLTALLAARRRFVLEVGCGHGHFLTAYAAAHPSVICVGIDLIGERIARAVRKRDRAKLSNLHFVQAEARLFLDVLPAGAEIETVFVLFPDPWPKLRHNKHRIMQTAFLARAAEHAAPDCPLYFRTDHTPYYDAVREVLAADAHWQLREEPWSFEYATVFQQRAETFHSLVARCKMHRTAANGSAAVGKGD